MEASLKHWKKKKACHLRILHPFNRGKKKKHLLDAVKKRTLIARSFRGMNIVKTLQLQKCGGISWKLHSCMPIGNTPWSPGSPNAISMRRTSLARNVACIPTQGLQEVAWKSTETLMRQVGCMWMHGCGPFVLKFSRTLSLLQKRK